MTIDLDALEATAKAATAGPWTYRESSLTRGLTLPYLVQSHTERRNVAEGYAGGEANLDLIVACSPEKVIELVEYVRSLEKKIKTGPDVAEILGE